MRFGLAAWLLWRLPGARHRMLSENVAIPQEIAGGWTIHEDRRIVKQVDSAPYEQGGAETGSSTAKPQRCDVQRLCDLGGYSPGRTCCSHRHQVAVPICQARQGGACRLRPRMRSHDLPTPPTRCTRRQSLHSDLVLPRALVTSDSTT